MIKNINFDDIVYLQSITNMSDGIIDFKTSINDVITEFSLFTQCVNNSINGPFKEFADSFKNLFMLGTNLKTAISGISDGVSAFKTLSDLGKAINILTGSSQASAIAINAKTAATTMDTTASTAATGAQALWNAVTNLFPAFALVAGLAAIALGIGAFIKWVNQASEEQKRLNEETAELKKKNEELTKSMKESEEAYKKNSDKMALQASTAEKLAEKVYALYEEEGKSAEQKHQLALMVDELNKAMPGLNLLYDEEADLLNKSSDAVKNLIAAKKEELMQEAMAERAVELLKEQLELEYQREEVSKKITEWENATDAKANSRKKSIKYTTYSSRIQRGVRSAAY